MQKVRTASGKEFNVNWCGQATLDLALRFGVPDGNMTELFQTFTSPAETQTLIHLFDEEEIVFTGFTIFNRSHNSKHHGDDQKNCHQAEHNFCK